MQSRSSLIALIAVLFVGALAWLYLGGDSSAEVATWDETDEIVLSEDDYYGGDLEGAPGADGEFRSEFAGEMEAGRNPGDQDRPLITITGRVIDTRRDPVAGAKVALSAQGRGRRNRIGKEVVTKGDGTFSFQGRGFSRMWVSLQVTHADYALASAFKPFDAAAGLLDMGDIEVVVGGSILGSITDMQGNFVSNAEARLLPDGRMRWRRNSMDLFPVVMADANGSFRIDHVAPGRYRITATAPHRQRRTEGPISVVDLGVERLEPIQLGPGYELSGTVFAPDGRPLAGADVSVRGNDRRVHEQNEATDKEGSFAFDHLPPGQYSVQVRAKGFLPGHVPGVEVTRSPPLTIHLEKGLRITGRVVDATSNAPVLRYGVQVRWVGGIPDPAAERRREQVRSLWRQIGDLSRGESADTPETRERIEKLQREARALSAADGERGPWSRGGMSGRGRGGESPRGWGRGTRGGGWRNRNSNLPGDTGEIEDHPDGKFDFQGLGEGVYVVDVGSPDHVRLRSERVELRRGMTAPFLNLVVARGLSVGGVVIAKSTGKPVRRAEVGLRLVLPEDESRRGGRRGVNDGGNRDQWRRMMQRMGSGSGLRTTRLLSTRTDDRGMFAIENTPRGKYLLRAQAEGYTAIESGVFELREDRSDFELVLGALCVLEGRVSGIPTGGLEEVRVMAWSFPSNFRDVNLKPDGTYRITGLQPGAYIVRAILGNARRFVFREMFRGMGRSENSNEPLHDVEIGEGQTKRLDLVVVQDPTGTVVGEVLVNGKAAKGYRVQLRRLDTERDGTQPGGRFGGFGRMGMNSSTVDQKGRYEIRNVEAGNYVLTITRRGRAGGGGDLSRRKVFVAPNQTVDVPAIAIDTGSLSGKVRLPEDAEGKASARGRVTLYKGVSEVPDPSVEGSEEVPRFTARVRDNAFDFRDLPSGDYLLQLRLPGRETAEQSIHVGGDAKEAIEVVAGKLRKEKQAPGTK